MLYTYRHLIALVTIGFFAWSGYEAYVTGREAVDVGSTVWGDFLGGGNFTTQCYNHDSCKGAVIRAFNQAYPWGLVVLTVIPMVLGIIAKHNAPEDEGKEPGGAAFADREDLKELEAPDSPKKKVT